MTRGRHHVRGRRGCVDAGSWNHAFCLRRDGALHDGAVAWAWPRQVIRGFVLAKFGPRVGLRERLQRHSEGWMTCVRKG